MSAIARVGCVILAFMLGCATSVALWVHWIPRCDDNCPVTNVVPVMVFLALLPTLATLSTVLLLAMKWPTRVKQAVVVALVVVAVGVGAWVSDLAASSAKVSGAAIIRPS